MPRLRLPSTAGSLADAVVEAVRDGVASGELRPEETYSVYQLAELLDVSRSPVREAITRMADAGLVEIARNRGFRVVLPSGRDLDEIIEVRLALECPAARRAAEEGTQEQHAEIAGALAAMAAAARDGDEARFWPADRTLHDAVLRAAGNRRAAAIVAQLRATTALLGPPTTASGRTLAEILVEHEVVIEAILRRDGDAAEASMQEHLVETGRLLGRRLARS